MYGETPYDVNTVGDSMTEQEHLDSCNINKMIKNALRGMDIRGGGSAVYGYDDTTMDAVQFRIQKQQLEEQLNAGQKEFTAKELELIPNSIVEKFGFKVKEADGQKSDAITTANGPTSASNTTPATLPKG